MKLPTLCNHERLGVAQQHSDPRSLAGNHRPLRVSKAGTCGLSDFMAAGVPFQAQG